MLSDSDSDDLYLKEWDSDLEECWRPPGNVQTDILSSSIDMGEPSWYLEEEVFGLGDNQEETKKIADIPEYTGSQTKVNDELQVEAVDIEGPDFEAGSEEVLNSECEP